MPFSAGSLWKNAGKLERALAIALAVYLIYVFALPPGAPLRTPFALASFILGIAVAIRWSRRGIKHAIWRLRNRLIVCYLFIGVVPILLILILLGLTGWVVMGQMAVHMVLSQLNNERDGLMGPASGLAATPVHLKRDRLRWVGPYFAQRYPGSEIVVAGDLNEKYPLDSQAEPPPRGWENEAGLLHKDRRLYLWAHAVESNSTVTILVPLSRQYLAGLVPNLGEVAVQLRFGPVQVTPDEPRSDAGIQTSIGVESRRRPPGTNPLPDDGVSRLPAAINRADISIYGWTELQVAIWESPGKFEQWLLAVSTRPSALLRTVYSHRVEIGQFFLVAFFIVAGLFLVVELVSLVIGVSITRTVTSAVHNLYEGTQRVMKGDFSHRIQVRRNDQLGELGQSFNRMTENLERLVKVEKEQQRMQSELEIAREVQGQLFPKAVPKMKCLELTAHCSPARMVSGDYYDYMRLQDGRLAIAVGDVAGKGISAALLMAAVQSTMRTQLSAAVEWSGRNGHDAFSPANLVSRLNQQLYHNTSPEKYATFYFAFYDDEKGVLTYTNAGHLPPIVIRNGSAIRLEVNGMVVGAFPFARYDQSEVTLEKDDLLICYTDGITEPENEYGEMFGEERLIETVQRNANRAAYEIIASVLERVQDWTGSPELQDDMTVLVARRL